MNSDDLIITAMLAGSAAFAGIVAYLLSGRDLGRGRRVSAALVSAVLVGLTSVFAPYLPVLAFMASAAAYLVMRRLLKPGVALAAAGVVLLGGLSFAVLAMVLTLDQM